MNRLGGKGEVDIIGIGYSRDFLSLRVGGSMGG